MDSIKPVFQNAARDPSVLDRGFDRLMDLARDADALILSDTDHRNNRTLIQDVFTPDRLQTLASQRFTDVFIEIPGQHQPLLDQLARGDITVDRFATDLVDAGGANIVHGPKDDKMVFAQGLGDTIRRAQDQGIRFHAASVDFTPDQRAHLSDFQDRLDANADAFQSTQFQFVRQFGDQLPPDQQRFVRNGLVDNSLDGIPLDDFRARLQQNLPENPNIPSDARADFIDKMVQIHQDRLSLPATRYVDRFADLRLDNDATLADNVVRDVSPTGRPIIVHGAAHGATRDDKGDAVDLDGRLQDLGLRTARVNIDLPVQRFGRRQGALADTSDITFDPRADTITLRDVNRDGFVNGHPLEPIARSPLTNNGPPGIGASAHNGGAPNANPPAPDASPDTPPDNSPVLTNNGPPGIGGP